MNVTALPQQKERMELAGDDFDRSELRLCWNFLRNLDAQDWSLSSAAVANIVAELLQEGIVVESGLEASQGGRPRSILSINSHYGYFLGVEVGDTLTRIELFDLTLHKLGAVAYPAVLSENQPEQVVQYIHQ